MNWRTDFVTMRLRPVQNKDLIDLSRWMKKESNYKWLDFNNGKQILGRALLKKMLQSQQHDFKLFSLRDKPIGMVALSNINNSFNTAYLWYVLGEKKLSGKQFTTYAVGKMLTYGFEKLMLESIYAWAVESDKACIRVLEKNNFRFIGKRRKCHRIGDQVYDRWLFDLLKEEHS